MSVEQFFELFYEELKSREKLREYYKFHEDPSKLPFRKSYFCQRLQYVLEQIQETGVASPKIWDCGCGYATTQIFLALNGFASRGTTLEFYYKEIHSRLAFWSNYGDMSLVKTSYEDVFSTDISPSSEDIIIVQDTLHHLEPLQQSLSIFYKTLKPGGVLIAIEENGNNLIQRLKLYKQRGNNRIIEYYDEGLGRTVKMGNENIRPYPVWRQEFVKAGFEMKEDKMNYVRFFPPSFFHRKTSEKVMQQEQALWRRFGLLREYFFFGVNFVAKKAS
ncbi:MAG: class I SAM-dependent methyltransferase [Saprospiraceae bacterium]|nr:class I SAM-dependent methyltransferase [Saprospiraceae bacterium]